MLGGSSEFFLSAETASPVLSTCPFSTNNFLSPHARCSLLVQATQSRDAYLQAVKPYYTSMKPYYNAVKYYSGAVRTVAASSLVVARRCWRRGVFTSKSVRFITRACDPSFTNKTSFSFGLRSLNDFGFKLTRELDETDASACSTFFAFSVSFSFGSYFVQVLRTSDLQRRRIM